MKIKNNYFTIFKNSTDLSVNLKDFSNAQTVQLNTTDALYIGYRKKVNQFFFELSTVNTANSVITVKKYNGTSWVDIESVDETKGFKQSGFIFIDEDENDCVEQALNGTTGFFYKIVVSVNTSAMVFSGVNIVFNNLNDLRMLEPAIEKFYPREISSHIYSIVAARDYIVRRINNAQPFNYYIYNVNALTGNYQVSIRSMNQMDIFDLNELRDASVYYALHLIFSNRSDDAQDVYREKSTLYKDKFEETFKLFTGRLLTIDINDDGKLDDDDKLNSIRTIKLVR